MSKNAILLPVVLSFALVPIAFGKDASADAKAAPAGLLRLKPNMKSGDPTPIAAHKFDVDDLSAQGITGASKEKKDGVDVLILPAGGECSRPLRGPATDVTFVSLQLYASHSTVIEAPGVRLGIITSAIAGSFQLAYDESSTDTPQWRPLRAHFGAEQFGGRLLAMLPTLTLRIDPKAGVWDIFSDSRLLADNLPLQAGKKNERHLVLHAGSDGAWLTGLVMSDENPLYEDDNGNGIDDRFERETRGLILPANASVAERKQLAASWKENQRARTPPALFVDRPMPDGTVVSISPTR
jgi:hypothetical protein